MHLYRVKLGVESECGAGTGGPHAIVANEPSEISRVDCNLVVVSSPNRPNNTVLLADVPQEAALFGRNTVLPLMRIKIRARMCLGCVGPVSR